MASFITDKVNTVCRLTSYRVIKRGELLSYCGNCRSAGVLYTCADR